MAVIRGPNRPCGDGERTQQVRKGSGNPYEEKTVLARSSDLNSARTKAAAEGDEKTRVVGTRSKGGSPPARDLLDDPVVGWLVIINGPGKGHFVKIGYGQNSIGRAAGQRIQLDFGDDQISREGHAFLIYDPKSRKYYIQNGGGSNLVYVDNNPVLAPSELAAGTAIMLGNTTAQFVPFCGAKFDWQDNKEPSPR